MLVFILIYSCLSFDNYIFDTFNKLIGHFTKSIFSFLLFTIIF